MRGGAPIRPMASIAINIATAITLKTPTVPNCFRTAAIKKDVKIAENLL